MTAERIARKLADDDLLDVLGRKDSPETLKALVRARLAALAAEDRRVNEQLPA